MRSLLRCRGALLFAAVIALSSPARGDDPSRQDLAKAGKAASVFVRVKDGSGSAFCVHASGLFLTNHHVIAGGGDVTLVLNANQKDQRVVKAKVVRSDPVTDLALLQAEGVKDFPFLQISSDDKLSEGTEVLACGFPLGDRLALAKDEYPAITISFGKVTSLRQKANELERIQIDAELQPGNSGGPILAADGKVVGVAVSIINNTSFRFAIPARKVLRFLEQPAVTFQPPAGEWQKPVPFEVRAISTLPSEKPFAVELILRGPDGKERKYPMKRVEDVFRAEAPILAAASPLPIVDCTVVVSRDGKEVARLHNLLVDEGKVPKLYLADLAEADFKKGPWDLGKGITGEPNSQAPISVGGKKSPKGLGMHPDCSVSYRLKKGAMLFRSGMGVLDGGRAAPAGEITFEVRGDDKVLWTSRPLFIRGDSDECTIDVKGINTLELRVSVKGNNFGASAAWLEPYVLADGDGLLRPDPEIAVDERERKITTLKAPAEDAVVGGGGRYLVLSLSKVRKIVVLDVTDPGMEKSIAMDEAGPVRIAAGADDLLVLYTDKNVLKRYNLLTLKKEESLDLVIEGKVTAMAFGSASYGPLLLVGERPPLTGFHQYVDVQRMKKMQVETTGNNGAHTGDGTCVQASADGRVFGVASTNFFSRGSHTALLQADSATLHAIGEKLAYACPGPDGRFIFTSNGVYTNRFKDRANGPSHRGTLCLPAAQGDFYLKAKNDSASLALADDSDPLAKITGVGWSGLLKDQPVPLFKRVFLVPAADLIVTIPAGNDEVHFHRFDFAKALEKASSDYLFVTAFAPPLCRKGETFTYQLNTQSKKGGIKYQINSGPGGMSISESGQIKWDVPKDATEGTNDVRVRIQDASGKETIYAFKVRVVAHSTRDKF